MMMIKLNTNFTGSNDAKTNETKIRIENSLKFLHYLTKYTITFVAGKRLRCLHIASLIGCQCAFAIVLCNAKRRVFAVGEAYRSHLHIKPRLRWLRIEKGNRIIFVSKAVGFDTLTGV